MARGRSFGQSFPEVQRWNRISDGIETSEELGHVPSPRELAGLPPVHLHCLGNHGITMVENSRDDDLVTSRAMPPAAVLDLFDDEGGH